MTRVLTTKQFIAKAINVHGNKFDYSKVYYENNRTEVCIICKVHGEFWQRPNHHLSQKQGCPACGGTRLKSREQFIEDALRIHGNSYDYSKVDYINNCTKVKIICQIHSEFTQTPHNHIGNKSKCPKCSNAGYSKISIQFLNDLAKD